VILRVRVALGFRGMTMKLKLAVIALFTVLVCGLYVASITLAPSSAFADGGDGTGGGSGKNDGDGD